MQSGQIKLNHYCFMEGVRGIPGEVIDVGEKAKGGDNRAAAAEIVSREGATWVDAPKPEAATRAAPENAAARTRAPAGR